MKTVRPIVTMTVFCLFFDSAAALAQYANPDWDEGSFSASGVWEHPTDKGKHYDRTEYIRCIRSSGLCFVTYVDVWANMGTHGHDLFKAEYQLFRIKKWDRYSIIGQVDDDPSPCEQDVLRIGRDNFEATVTAYPAYGNDKFCSKFLGPAKSRVWKFEPLHWSDATPDQNMNFLKRHFFGSSAETPR